MTNGMDRLKAPVRREAEQLATMRKRPSAEEQAKAQVIRLWEQSGITKTELARRLGVHEGEARRILDPNHRTALNRLDDAAMALGCRLVIATEKDDDPHG